MFYSCHVLYVIKRLKHFECFCYKKKLTQRRGCDLIPAPTAPESSTLTNESVKIFICGLDLERGSTGACCQFSRSVCATLYTLLRHHIRCTVQYLTISR